MHIHAYIHAQVHVLKLDANNRFKSDVAVQQFIKKAESLRIQTSKVEKGEKGEGGRGKGEGRREKGEGGREKGQYAQLQYSNHYSAAQYSIVQCSAEQ